METMILKRRKREEKGGSKQRKEGQGKGAILIKSASMTCSWAWCCEAGIQIYYHLRHKFLQG
jgi:hypothetical protein